MAGVAHFVSSQPQYSMLWQARSRGDPVLQFARHLANRVVAPGTGGADRKIPAGRRGARRLPRGERRHEHRLPAELAGNPGAAGGRSVAPVADEAGLSPAQFALAWCCANQTSRPPSWARPVPNSSTTTRAPRMPWWTHRYLRGLTASLPTPARLKPSQGRSGQESTIPCNIRSSAAPGCASRGFASEP